MSGTAAAQRRADLALVFVTFVWGAAFVVVKRALDDVSTILFLTIRFTIAALLLAAYFRRGWMPRTAPHWRASFAVAACLGAGYALQTLGLETTTPANAGFITGFYIPLVPVLGAAFARKVPSRVEVSGIALATIGIALLTLPEGGLRVRAGDLLVLAGAVAFAGHILVLGHYSRTTPHEVLSFAQIAIAAGFGWCTFWWVETPRIAWTGAVIGALAATALFATAFALAIQTWAQKLTTAARTALIFSLEPVFAWLTSFVMTGEVLTMRAAFGALLVLAAILLVELSKEA